MTKIDKAKQAFERRFGRSVMPLAAREFTHENGGQCVRITDRETGSWAEYNISGWRVRLLSGREHDAMAA